MRKRKEKFKFSYRVFFSYSNTAKQQASENHYHISYLFIRNENLYTKIITSHIHPPSQSHITHSNLSTQSINQSSYLSFLLYSQKREAGSSVTSHDTIISFIHPSKDSSRDHIERFHGAPANLNLQNKSLRKYPLERSTT